MKTNLLIVHLLAHAFFNSLFAQSPGSLDVDFGTSGFETYDVNGLDDRAENLTLLQDGNILCSGKTQVGLFSFDMLAVNVLSTGVLESSFGQDGFIIKELVSTNDGISDFFELEDGEVLAVGFTTVTDNSDYALLLYDSDGNEQQTFGTNGLLTVDIGGISNVPGSSSFTSASNLLIVGNMGDSICLSKMNGYTEIDISFGESGHVFHDLTPNEDFAADLQLLADGSMVVAGYTGSGALSDGFISMFHADGSVKNSFGNAGFLNLSLSSSYDIAVSSRVLPDNRILVIGSAWDNTSTSEFFALRLMPDGSYDNSFGTNGIVRYDIGSGDDYASALVLQPDGKAIIGGTANNGNDNNFCLIRINEDGSLDPTFGNNGIVITEVSPDNDGIADMELQADGKLVVAGTARVGTNDDIAIARYHTGINTSVAEIGAESKLSVFPNPAVNQLTVTSEKTLNNVELLDALGRTVLTQTSNANRFQLDLSQIPSGIYLLRATDGERMFTQKVVKE